jgi:NAD(P) transhydrogenase subunit alpha
MRRITHSAGAVAPAHPGRTNVARTRRTLVAAGGGLAALMGAAAAAAQEAAGAPAGAAAGPPATDHWSLLFVFVLSSFIGLGVIRRVSRLLHTPLMSITNAISAIAVVGSIIVTGADYPPVIRLLGAIALFASMTNIVSGFLITDRMLKMFKSDKPGAGGRP